MVPVLEVEDDDDTSSSRLLVLQDGEEPVEEASGEQIGDVRVEENSR